MISVLQNIDEQIVIWVQQNLNIPILNEIMVFTSVVGNVGICWILLCIALLFNKKTRKAGIIAGISLALGALCTNIILKPIILRDRPEVAIENFIPLLSAPDAHSFPSGHATAAFACAVALWFQLKNRLLANVLMFFAALMAVSRIYVGAHYLSDVIAGVFIGSLCAVVVCTIQKKFFKNKIG